MARSGAGASLAAVDTPTGHRHSDGDNLASPLEDRLTRLSVENEALGPHLSSVSTLNVDYRAALAERHNHRHLANRERQGVWRQLQLKTISQYYRSESAARALSVDDLDLIGSPRWIHVTGITPALSPSCLELVEAIVERRSGHRGGSAFDVNHRPALWPDTSTAARVLLSLSRQADVVFIGDDEAASLYGTSEVQVLASLILRRDDQELVLKRGAGPASVVTHRGEISVPALPAEVVATTGAGDSFAAGYPPRPCSDGLHRIDCGWAFSWRHES